jgi:porphobilinogen synthase
MIHAAAQKGWMDSDKVMLEALTAIKRAGADIIVSYAARWIAEYLKEHGQ